MALEDTFPSQETVEDATTHNVGIHVTADVQVIRYGRITSSDDIDSPNCKIKTSLTAIFNEYLTPKEGTNPAENTEETYSSDLLHTSTYYQENFDQPLVRRSNKCTALNNSITVLQFAKRDQIERTFILPYLGCSTRNESYIGCNRDVLVRSSKSWENVIKRPNSKGKCRPLHPQSLNRPSFSKSLTDISTAYQSSAIGENSIKCLINSELEKYKTNLDSSEPIKRNVYFSEELSTESKTQLSNKKYWKCGNQDLIKEYTKPIELPMNCPYNSALSINIFGFEQELALQSPRYHKRPTRNVSILHRPRTREVATSTTSLNNGMEQTLDNSIKGILMPFISAGTDFPSELVLKLIPKKEAENKLGKDADGEVNSVSTHSSGTNLLVPVLNTPPKRKKKKHHLLSCFSKSKKKDKEDLYELNSSDTLEREVYFPSVVEVYKGKKRKQPKVVDSDTISVTSSVFIRKKKK